MSKILVTGGTGMLGSALRDLIPEAIFLSSAHYDLTSKEETFRAFEYIRPEKVFT